MQFRLLLVPLGIFFILASMPLASFASGPGSSWSTIDGVILWNLHKSGSSTASATFEGDGSDDPFLKYCDGKNKTYIYELDSSGYVCQSGKSNEYYGFDVKGISVELDGVYTISKYPIVQKAWRFVPLNITEATTAQETVKKFSTKKGEEYDKKSALGLYDKYEGKITVGTKTIAIVPSEYLYYEGSNEDLVSVVVVMESGSNKAIGRVDGCFQKLADIDGDGVPEIMTKTCQAGLWLHIDYWKIYPVVKRLASFSY